MRQDVVRSRGFLVTCSVVGSLGIVVIIGYVASPDGFDWGTAVDAGTAVGTTLLAITTAWMAFETRQELGHTRRIVEMQENDETRKDQAWISTQSALVLWPGPLNDTNNVFADVEIVNAGHGPAIDVIASLEVWGSREKGSGRVVLGVKKISLLIPMSTKTFRVFPNLDVKFSPDRNLRELTCINIQYRDKLTRAGTFREAEPFWDLTPAMMFDGTDPEYAEFAPASQFGFGRPSMDP
jgi:hypothetical protein